MKISNFFFEEWEKTNRERDKRYEEMKREDEREKNKKRENKAEKEKS